MEKLTLYEELRLIERSENEVNGAWKGAHLLLFFLAFVFGSFCTFCFHMLMYLFDEKCVLFPKLLSLTSLRHNVIYEFIPDKADLFPVDFLSTQWVDKSACYLPTYVPLVSGIFGLVWTTMFLMCSTGNRTLAGLQRSWRVIPPVFVFSLAMGGLCVYSSTVTHYGLQELCIKLGEITGSTTCSYTVNVATLAYERQIRGVYQATRLTIISAWLHTCCWLLSALLALVRILLAVDFQLVRVSAELIGDLDKILENYEEHIRTFNPEHGLDIKSSSNDSETGSEINFDNSTDSISNDLASLFAEHSDILFLADDHPPQESVLSLVPDEQSKLARLETYNSVAKDKVFIIEMLYDLVDNMKLPESDDSPTSLLISSSSSMVLLSETMAIARQFGKESIASKTLDETKGELELVNQEEIEQIAKHIKRNLQERLYQQLIQLTIEESIAEDTSKKRGHIAFESSMQITPEMKKTIEENRAKSLKEDKDKTEEPIGPKKKSNLKNIGIQTDKQKKSEQKVKISESKSTYFDDHTDSGDESSDDKSPGTSKDK